MEKSLAVNFFELSVDMLCIANVEGYFKFINPAFNLHLGYSNEELLSKQFYQLIHPDDVAKTFEEVKKLAEGKRVLHFENRYRTKEGKYIIVDWTCQPDTETGLLYAIGRNISYRKQLESQNQILERAIDAASTGIVITRADLEDMPITYVNKSFEKLTGYRKNECIGKNCRFLNRNDRNQEGLKRLRNKLKKGKEVRELLKNFKKDGTLFYNELSITPVFDANKNITHFIGSINDVTEKLFEEQLLRNNQKNLNLALNSANLGLWEWNNSSDSFDASESWCENIGSKGSLEISKMKDWMELIHPEDRRKIIRTIVGLSLNEANEYKLEYRLKLPSGDIWWIQDIGKVLEWDDSGTASRIIGTHLNITDRKKKSIDLKESHDLLAKRFIEFQHFAHIISHNLRAPLTNIMGLTQIASEHVHGVEELKFAIDSLEEQTSNMDEIIRDLNKILDVRQRLPKRKSIINIEKLLGKLQILLQDDLRESQAQIYVDRIEVKNLKSYSSYLEKSLSLLIQRAIFNQDPTKKLEIRIESALNGPDSIIINIAYNGLGFMGINEDEEIFNSFNKLFPEQTITEINHLMLWQFLDAIDARLEIGKNSQMWPQFNLIIKDSIHQKLSDLSKIYIIDDDLITTKIHQRIIRKASPDLRIEVFTDAQDAVEILSNLKREDLPDLILLDINMPKMNAWEFLEALEESMRFEAEELCIVILSSSISQTDLIKAENYPSIYTFISKPFSIVKWQEISSHFFDQKQH